MKKTIIFKNIDGFDIIRGVDHPIIEPVETNKAVAAALPDTPEYKAAEAKKVEYSKAVEDMAAASKARNRKDYDLAVASLRVRQDEIKPLAKDLKAVVTRLRNEKAVYFEPRPGEVIMDASEVDTLLQAIQAAPKGTYIALDGSQVQDNRGRTFFRRADGKWGRTYIDRLGIAIPEDAVLAEDVTDVQRDEIEMDRVGALDQDQKAKEKDKAMGATLNQAADMRNELEIKADPDALTKSQDWYRNEVSRITGLYG